MKKVLVSGMIGNGLEWYDYALYGQMAWLLSRLFFPEGDATVALLATYGVFAAGFIVRPLGAVLFGWIGDKYGRKRAMVIAVLMMALPTGCIGLLPTYAEIGILAPILLTIIRLLQGLSLGGEFAGSMVYIVEHAPQNKRGVAGAASLISLNLGFLCGVLVTQGFIHGLGMEAFEAWGWRIPFIMGIAIGLIGFYIRTHCSESPIYEEAKQGGHIAKAPLRRVLRDHPKKVLQAFTIYIAVTMPFYLAAIYFISFSHKQLGVSMQQALEFSIINITLMMLAYYPAAKLSDVYGRKKVMMTASIIIFCIIYPIFTLFTPDASVLTIGAGQAVFAFVLGFYLGPVAALLVEMFPTSVRYTGMAISYNMTAAIFGGTAPFVCEWLITTTGNYSSVAYYVMLCNAVALIALWGYKDRYKEALN